MRIIVNSTWKVSAEFGSSRDGVRYDKWVDAEIACHIVGRITAKRLDLLLVTGQIVPLMAQCVT